MYVCTYFHVEGLYALWVVDYDGRLPVDLYSYMHAFIHTYIHTDKGMMRNSWISQPNLLGDVSLMLGSQVVAPVRILLKLHLYKYFKGTCMYCMYLTYTCIHTHIHTYLLVLNFFLEQCDGFRVRDLRELALHHIGKTGHQTCFTYIHTYIHTYIYYKNT